MSLNEITVEDFANRCVQVAYSANLNASPRYEKELEEVREMIDFLKEVDGVLSDTPERIFEQFDENWDEDRELTTFTVIRAFNSVCEEKGEHHFPLDDLTRVRWVIGLLEPWSMDADMVSFTDEQSSSLYEFFLALEKALLTEEN